MPSIDSTPSLEALDSVTTLQTQIQELRRQLEEKNQLIAQLEQDAFHDPLTGVYNLRFYKEGLRRAENDRSVESATIMVIDRDDLKPLNDTHGHAIGDKDLINLTSAISKHIRAGDILARIGGDEFAILFPNLSDPEDVYKVLLKLYDALNTGDVSASIGVATSVRTDGILKLQEAQLKADVDMYKAKALKNEDATYRPPHPKKDVL